MQRIHLASEQTDPHPVDEGLPQEELESRSAASSSQNWQSAQLWWSNWEWTPGREQWWEQPAWQQESSVEEWQDQTATTAAEAKQKARVEKRMRQKAKKVEANINPADFKLGQVHLGDIRTAQKLWQIFPHDEDSRDLVLKFCGGIEVPDDLFEEFKLELGTDHRWGLWVQPREYATAPLKRKLVLKPNPAYNRAEEAGRLKSELECTTRRLCSPSRSPIRRRIKGPPDVSGRRQAETAQVPPGPGRW